MNMRKYFIVALLFPMSVLGQDFKWDRTLDVLVSPSISTSLLGGITADEKGGFKSEQLADSFKKSDVSNSFVNFGIAFTFRKTDRKAFSVGLSYLTTGFTRQKEGNMFNYLPHPELSVYANLSEGPTQILNYDFNYTYLTLDLHYLGRIDGATMVLKNTKWWYFLGVAPSLLIKHNVVLRTQGFTLVEGNNLEKYDYTVDYNSKGIYSNSYGAYNITKVSPPAVNVFLTAGTRFDYTLTETMHLVLQPKVNLPILPSATGVQVAWCPQASIDVGIIWPLH
jgi:hypothetical protein